MITLEQINELIHQNYQLQAELLTLKEILKEDDLRTTSQHQSAAEGHVERMSAVLSDTKPIHTY